MRLWQVLPVSSLPMYIPGTEQQGFLSPVSLGQNSQSFPCTGPLCEPWFSPTFSPVGGLWPTEGLESTRPCPLHLRPWWLLCGPASGMRPCSHASELCWTAWANCFLCSLSFIHFHLAVSLRNISVLGQVLCDGLNCCLRPQHPIFEWRFES